MRSVKLVAAGSLFTLVAFGQTDAKFSAADVHIEREDRNTGDAPVDARARLLGDQERQHGGSDQLGLQLEYH